MTNILFLTLKVFSAMGGIEKVCRVAGKAMHDMHLTGPVRTRVMSMHDHTEDAYNNRYFPAELFEGYSAKKIRFIHEALRRGRAADVVVLSHINLLLVGWLIKKFSPRTRVCLIAHGIEVWGTLRGFKGSMIHNCDLVLCVSSYTKKILEQKHGVSPARAVVLNNCIDPFLPVPRKKEKLPVLLQANGFGPDDIILFTLSRLSSKDRYKGYDQVFEALALLKESYPRLRYLIGGGYDKIEKTYVDENISRLQLGDIVKITGYLPEEDLAAYFAMADIYIMPSKKEGFGIVFVEAMYYGLPVIAGNVDGSVDALLQGELGLLVNPSSVEEIKEAIEKMITAPAKYLPNRHRLMEHFGYEVYKDQLAHWLTGPLPENHPPQAPMPLKVAMPCSG